MTYDIVTNSGTSVLTVSFLDEGVNLTKNIHVDSAEEAALMYLPFFERDLRHNYSHLFPQLEPITEPEGGME